MSQYFDGFFRRSTLCLGERDRSRCRSRSLERSRRSLSRLRSRSRDLDLLRECSAERERCLRLLWLSPWSPRDDRLECSTEKKQTENRISKKDKWTQLQTFIHGFPHQHKPNLCQEKQKQFSWNWSIKIEFEITLLGQIWKQKPEDKSIQQGKTETIKTFQCAEEH